ncbi:MAG: radical SAM protein [Deltaproteobacteria bacterium]|nr:radical SAM protein [Deltaproteobacteria bacterium]MBW2136943.1 radical SAM protein [Deltaproteobacteria bacterium]
MDMLDQVAEEGCLWLLITGGEPLIRKDFTDILASAKKKGFLITLFTNGTLLTGERADYLAEWSPLSIEISLYGASSDTHDRITGVPGACRNTLKGIELILERKLPLELKTVVMTRNRHELFQMKELAEGLGLKFRLDPVINPRLDGSMAPCNFCLGLTERSSSLSGVLHAGMSERGISLDGRSSGVVI